MGIYKELYSPQEWHWPAAVSLGRRLALPGAHWCLFCSQLCATDTLSLADGITGRAGVAVHERVEMNLAEMVVRARFLLPPVPAATASQPIRADLLYHEGFSGRKSFLQSRHRLLIPSCFCLWMQGQWFAITRAQKKKPLLAQTHSHSNSVTEHPLGIWPKQPNAIKKAIGFMF